MAAGAHTDRWDGLDDLGRNLPPGKYQVRVACSNVTFTSVGTIGNSGKGTSMQAGTDDLIVDPKNGDIYTADNWEEAGQDFRKIDADGMHLMDAKFGVRNGKPNGWPIAVALDNGILYCSVFTANDVAADEKTFAKGGAVIRKFDSTTGKPLKFPTDTGFIRVRFPDPSNESYAHQSLHSICICGNTIVVTRS